MHALVILTIQNEISKHKIRGKLKIPHRQKTIALLLNYVDLNKQEKDSMKSTKPKIY